MERASVNCTGNSRLADKLSDSCDGSFNKAGTETAIGEINRADVTRDSDNDEGSINDNTDNGTKDLGWFVILKYKLLILYVKVPYRMLHSLCKLV